MTADRAVAGTDCPQRDERLGWTGDLMASIAWTRHERNMLVDVVLPPGTSGRFVAPPGWSAAEQIGILQSGQHHFVLKS